MKKRRLKIKNLIWVIFVIGIFFSLGIYSYHKISKNIIYKQSNEYKLLQIGYTLKEITVIEKNLTKQQIESLFKTKKNEFLIDLLTSKYYLSKNLERYIAFYQDYPEYKIKDIISLVNTRNDYDYYDNIINTQIKNDYLLLVNKYYYLNENYIPNDLVSISNKYYYGNNHKIQKMVYDAFKDMWNVAHNEGIYLIINSSYRDYETQVNIYNTYKNSQGTSYADKFAARPGHSEHQTGLALDIFSKTHSTTANFKNSPAYIWLANNAHKFGFIQRYPENKENITGFEEESWHWRYVGIDVATYIYNNKLTFDEYYAYYLEEN